MAMISDLMGLGMPGPLASLLGNTPTTIAGVGTSQAGAAKLNASMVQLTTGSGQTAFIFNSAASLSRLYFIYNSSATTALLFPGVGGTIVGSSQDASLSLAQNKSVMVWHYSSLIWVPLISA